MRNTLQKHIYIYFISFGLLRDDLRAVILSAVRRAGTSSKYLYLQIFVFLQEIIRAYLQYLQIFDERGRERSAQLFPFFYGKISASIDIFFVGTFVETNAEFISGQ